MKNKVFWGILGITLLALVHILWYVHRFAVSYPVTDQWGLWMPFLKEMSIAEGFFYQHGSHFLGVGYLVSLMVGNISGFTLAAEGYTVAVLMAGNALIAINLKKKLLGQYQWLDLFMPLIFLNPGFREVFLSMMHASVSALPLMAILLLGHLVLAKNSIFKALALGILFFLAAFTGYAFLVSGLCLLYTFYLMRKPAYRQWLIISLSLQIFAITLFISKYQLYSSSVCGLHSDKVPYLEYILTLLFHFIYREPARITGIVILCAGILAPLGYTLFIKQKNIFKSPAAVVNGVLLLFSLSYIGLNAYSRACLGVQAAYSPRYMIFLIPIFLSCYFFMAFSFKDKIDFQQLVPVLFVFTFMMFWSKSNMRYKDRALSQKETLKQWRICFEESYDARSCSQKIKTYPLRSLDNKKMMWEKFLDLQRKN